MITHTSDARGKILARIQQANRKTLDARIELSEQNPGAVWQSLSRNYAHAGVLSAGDVLTLFEQRLDDYGAHVFHASLAELPQVVERILANRRKAKILAPAGLPAVWLPKNVPLHVDDGNSAAELDQYEGVLTGATVAIAVTGTIVLQNAAGQGRRALSLVPDYHLCIVRTDQVVETVPEAFARLSATNRLPTTFVSGPSATADIEMTRIQGVHGPRVLDVVLLKQEEENSSP